MEIIQLLLGHLESHKRWLSTDSRWGNRFSGGRSARVSSVCCKGVTEGSRRWSNGVVSVQGPLYAAKPDSEGGFPADSHPFFIILLCWHHNTNGGRERAREKMNVLISVLGEERSGSRCDTQHGNSSAGRYLGYISWMWCALPAMVLHTRQTTKNISSLQHHLSYRQP